MDLFLHICCGPCAVFPLKVLAVDGFRIRGFFYNPNIHPSREYALRRDAALKLSDMTDIPVETGVYDMERFFACVDAGPERCGACYDMRLDTAARTAAAQGFKRFSTTLLYSRRQNHERIREAARRACDAHHITFVYRDFREGWQEGIDESKRLGLYRQNYCGCVYSERERFYNDRRT